MKGVPWHVLIIFVGRTKAKNILWSFHVTKNEKICSLAILVFVWANWEHHLMYAYFNNKNEKCLFALLLSSEGEVPWMIPTQIFGMYPLVLETASLATGYVDTKPQQNLRIQACQHVSCNSSITCWQGWNKHTEKKKQNRKPKPISSIC